MTAKAQIIHYNNTYIGNSVEAVCIEGGDEMKGPQITWDATLDPDQR
jgi:hypothetical protein